MKYALMIIGWGVAGMTYHWFPAVFSELVKVPGFPAGIAAIGTLLTAGWVICLSKLSVFEKLEELPSSGRDNVMGYARAMRKRIIFTVIFNCLFATVSIVSTFAAQVPTLAQLSQLNITSWVGYALSGTLGFWLGGSVDSWSCYSAIETTREQLLLAQIETKKRSAYLSKIRADAVASPIPKDDAHLSGYTADA